MARRGWRAVAVTLAAIVALGVALTGTHGGRHAGKAVLEWPLRLRRGGQPVDSEPGRFLAASQVGYAPGMEKQFTSDRPFSEHRVVREADGTAVCLTPDGAHEVQTPGGPAWVGDVSAVTAPGRYLVVAGERRSHPFSIGPDVFAAPRRAVQRAFYYQRAFTAVAPEHAEGPWSHASDAHRAPPGVRGGWHDAGDFSLYSASTSSALFWMLETWRSFHPRSDDTDLPESGNGVPDLLDEVRWGLDWYLSVQDASGGFANATCLETYGPYGTNRPESGPRYRAGEVGTLATARAVGTLASAAEVFDPVDPAFAARLLSAARRGQAFLDAHPETSDGPTCPAYRADGDELQGRQSRMLAAAAMLLATGEQRFRDDFARHRVPLTGDPSYRQVGGLGVRLYLRAPTADPALAEVLERELDLLADRSLAEGAANAYGRSAATHWGSIAAGFIRAGALHIPRCMADRHRHAADCRQALATLHHALGRNPLHLAYLSGLPGVVHGRAHAFHHWLATLDAHPFLFPGLVAGGPNATPEPDDTSRPLARPRRVWGYWGDPAFPRNERTPYEQRYTDNDSWSTNEVSLDWQAPTLHLLAFAEWVALNPDPPDTAPPLVDDGKLPRCDRPAPRD